MRDNLRIGLTLMIICLVAAGALGVTYVFTKGQIDKQIKIKQDAANIQALPVAKIFKQVNPAQIKKKGIKLVNEQDKIFQGLNGDSNAGYTFVVHPRGYGGIMEVAVGISAEGKVKAVVIILNRETPGLGDQAFKPNFIKQFIGSSPKDKVEVKKDIDAVSGATISSKGLTKGVRTALDYYKKIND